MYLSGFADEAAHSLAGQIAVTKRLGWRHIESRKIDGVNLHDLSEAAFEQAVGQLEESGVAINCFGSAIANWGKSIEASDAASQEEVARAIPRMLRLRTPLIRIMSYALLPGRPPEQQESERRFARLREITRRFLDHGLQPVHENCNNYGGMGWPYTLRLLEEVPGLKLVFDTGNPVQDDDWTQDPRADGSRPKQSSWEFYRRVAAHIVHVHIKDAIWDDAAKQVRHTMPGEGQGEVRAIVRDLLAHGYQGGFSIEPHLAVVHHDPTVTAEEAIMEANYLAYGERFMAIITEVQADLAVRPARSLGQALR